MEVTNMTNNRWVDKEFDTYICIHIFDYQSAVTGLNLAFCKTWMDLEGVMLNEKSGRIWILDDLTHFWDITKQNKDAYQYK